MEDCINGAIELCIRESLEELVLVHVIGDLQIGEVAELVRFLEVVHGKDVAFAPCIERGDQVRGISLKLQEEERERRMDFVPDVSAVDVTNALIVDPETKALLSKLGLAFADQVTVQNTQARPQREFTRGPRRE